VRWLVPEAGGLPLDISKEFTTQILHQVGFKEPGTTFLGTYDIPLISNGENTTMGDEKDFNCIFLVRNGRTIVMVVRVAYSATDYTESDPIAPVIASAIGAFQQNNVMRARSGLRTLDEMTIPCITVLRTRSIFYKFPVTKELSDAVVTLHYPSQPTKAVQCAAVTKLGRITDEMDDVAFRKVALQHYDAFRDVAKQCWSAFAPGE
jgi:hypothetical protein